MGWVAACEVPRGGGRGPRSTLHGALVAPRRLCGSWDVCEACACALCLSPTHLCPAGALFSVFTLPIKSHKMQNSLCSNHSIILQWCWKKLTFPNGALSQNCGSGPRAESAVSHSLSPPSRELRRKEGNNKQTISYSTIGAPPFTCCK